MFALPPPVIAENLQDLSAISLKYRKIADIFFENSAMTLRGVII